MGLLALKYCLVTLLTICFTCQRFLRSDMARFLSIIHRCFIGLWSLDVVWLSRVVVIQNSKEVLCDFMAGRSGGIHFSTDIRWVEFLELKTSISMVIADFVKDGLFNSADDVIIKMIVAQWDLNELLVFPDQWIELIFNWMLVSSIA